MSPVYTRRPRVSTPSTVCLIVEPVGEFRPTNWQHHPRRFRLIEEACNGTLGKTDTEKFLFNQEQRKLNDLSKWAIVVTVDEFERIEAAQ